MLLAFTKHPNDLQTLWLQLLVSVVLPVIEKMTLWVLMESLNERLEVIVQDSALLRFDRTE